MDCMQKSAVAVEMILVLLLTACSYLPAEEPYTEADMQRCMEPYLRGGLETEGRMHCTCAVYREAQVAHDWEVSPELCNIIPNTCESERNDCANELGEHFKDRRKCDQLEQDVDVSVCKAGVAFWVSDISLCESIPSTHFDLPDSSGMGGRFLIREQCFHRVAVDTKDLALCQRITNQIIREICEDDIRFDR